AGKTVVLEWTNYGCPYVKKHYNEGHMQALQGKMTGKDVVWLSICSSAEGKQGYMSNADWKKVSARKGVQSTAILLDADGKVGRAYGARATPHMFVIDEKGLLAYNGAIDSIRSTSPSDVDKAENYVQQAVNALMGGAEIKNAKTKPYGCGIKYAPYDS
ncbi:MAG: redoxin family protein, partial [Verrucomicrobiota bacterium]